MGMNVKRKGHKADKPLQKEQKSILENVKNNVKKARGVVLK
jgi:hypothetical protein